MTSNDERSHDEWSGRLTPSDVHNVLFTRAGLGRRGYDEVEVDVFLERVQQELTRLIGEKADLRDEVSASRRSSRRPRRGRRHPLPVTPSPRKRRSCRLFACSSLRSRPRTCTSRTPRSAASG